MSGSSSDTLGIIAGGGRLPGLLVQACKTRARPYLVVGLEGHADDLPEPPALWARLGDAGKMFRALHEAKVTAVVMAGKVQRPDLRDLKPDWRTIRFLARTGIRAFTRKEKVGDDRLLRSVIDEIEREGLSVIGVDSILSDLLVPNGPLTENAPTEHDQPDIQAGIDAARALGAADIGQAVVVQNGAVLAAEDAAGTDYLIHRGGDLKQDGSGPILIKVSKPQQDRRADLPTVGPETVEACLAAGFRGIAIEAGGTLVMNRADLCARADGAGLWVVACSVSTATDQS